MSPSDVRLVIAIPHARFRPERQRVLARLLDSLKPDPRLLDVVVFDNNDATCPATRSTKNAIDDALERYGKAATHILSCDDDIFFPPNFVEIACRAIASHPDDFLSFVPFVHAAAKLRARGASWYTSPDGAVYSIMPIRLMREFRAWWDRCIVGDPPSDNAGVTWAMATGRMIHVTTHALASCPHDVPSLLGNDGEMDDIRVVEADPEALERVDWTVPPVHVGRTFKEASWKLLTAVRPEYWAEFDCVRKTYALYRDRPIEATT